jgi:hypothetical protein
MFTTATMPPTTVGNCTSPCASRSAAVSGMSEAPKYLLVVDLPDALARPDRLIGDADTGLLFVGVGPFRVDRKRKGGAGAGNLGAGGRGDGGRGDAPGGRKHLQEGSSHWRSAHSRERTGTIARDCATAPLPGVSRRPRQDPKAICSFHNSSMTRKRDSEPVPRSSFRGAPKARARNL